MSETTKQKENLKFYLMYDEPAPSIGRSDASYDSAALAHKQNLRNHSFPSDFRERFKVLLESFLIDQLAWEKSTKSSTLNHSTVLQDIAEKRYATLLDFIATVRQGGVEEGRKQVIEEVFKVEAEKWQDVEHCACLGYALVQISGGEDSEGGKAMEKRLADLFDSLSK